MIRPRGILIVDDDESVLQVISDWLTRAGYRTFVAEGVKSALKVFQDNREHIDLLMADIRLRFESGFDLADALEQQYGFGDHAFFTSFVWEKEIAEDLLRRGKPYFEKPLKFKREVLPFLESYFEKQTHEP